MGTEGFLRETIQAIGERAWHALPGQPAWAGSLTKRILEYICGPILDHGGRYPWWGLLAALIIAGCVFVFFRDRASSDRQDGFFRFCFPSEIWRGPSTWVDLKVGFVNYVLFGGGALNLTWRVSTALFASWVTVVLSSVFGPIEHHATWGPLFHRLVHGRFLIGLGFRIFPVSLGVACVSAAVGNP